MVIKIVSALAPIIFPILIVAILLVAILGWSIPRPPDRDPWGDILPTSVSYDNCIPYAASDGYYIRENTDPETKDLLNEYRHSVEDGVSRYNEQVFTSTNVGQVSSKYNVTENNVTRQEGQDVPLLSDRYVPIFQLAVDEDSNVVEDIAEGEGGSAEDIEAKEDVQTPEQVENRTVFVPRDIEVEARVRGEDEGVLKVDFAVDVFASFKVPEPVVTEGEGGEEIVTQPPQRSPELLTTLRGEAGAPWKAEIIYGEKNEVFQDENFIGLYASARFDRVAPNADLSHLENVKLLTRFGLSDEETPAFVQAEEYSNQSTDYTAEERFLTKSYTTGVVNGRFAYIRQWVSSPLYSPNFYEAPPAEPTPPVETTPPTEAPPVETTPLTEAPPAEPVPPALVLTPHNLRVTADITAAQRGFKPDPNSSYRLPLHDISKLSVDVRVVKVVEEGGVEKEKILKVDNYSLMNFSLKPEEIPSFTKINTSENVLTRFFTNRTQYTYDVPYFLFKDDLESGKLVGFRLKLGLPEREFPRDERTLQALGKFALSDKEGTVSELPFGQSGEKRFPYEIAIDAEVSHAHIQYQGTYNTQRWPGKDLGELDELNIFRSSKWETGAFTPNYNDPALNGITNRDVEVMIRNYSDSSEQDVELRFFDARGGRIDTPGQNFVKRLEKMGRVGDDVKFVVPKVDTIDKYGIKSIKIAAKAKWWNRYTHIKYIAGLADAESKTTVTIQQDHVAPWPDNVSLDFVKVKIIGDEASEYRTLAASEDIARNTYPEGHVFSQPMGNFINTEEGDPNPDSDRAGVNDPNVQLEGDTEEEKDPPEKESTIGDESVFFTICPTDYSGASDSISGSLASWMSWAEDEENWKSVTDGGNAGIDVDGAYGAQCADLSKSWIKAARGLSTPPLLTAIDGFMGNPVSGGNNFPPEGVVQRDLGETDERILPGDIVFFTFGHTAVVVGGQDEAGLFEVLEQNPGSPARKQYSLTNVLSVWKVETVEGGQEE